MRKKEDYSARVQLRLLQPLKDWVVKKAGETNRSQNFVVNDCIEKVMRIEQVNQAIGGNR